ncbi:hypothetical protein VP01_131g7 [Puccinia sorghi]|uniref:ATP-dependent DNA helicase n=1 Tax=Puccinia sorghi TaxID=27349 RepID=A0A0L6VMN6_9BASI|nr:hypothetical protein VP01_131g7 [Puccinia sorghi]
MSIAGKAFLSRPGGTGKTHILNFMIDLALSGRQTPLVFASTSFAALILTNGQTAHLCFSFTLSLHAPVNALSYHFQGKELKL